MLEASKLRAPHISSGHCLDGQSLWKPVKWICRKTRLPVNPITLNKQSHSGATVAQQESTLLSIRLTANRRGLSAIPMSQMFNLFRKQKYFLIWLSEHNMLLFKSHWTYCRQCHFALGLHEDLRWLELTGVSYSVSIRPWLNLWLYIYSPCSKNSDLTLSL